MNHRSRSDARGQAKAERAFYRGQELQVCKVCGRWFRAQAKAGNVVCSAACKARAESREGQHLK